MRVLHVLDHSLPLHSGYAFRTAAILREQRALGYETLQMTTPRQHNGEALAEDVGSLRFHRTRLRKSVLEGMPGLRYVREVAATARPPVVRIMDYGKYKFEMAKQARVAKKKQHVIELKEVKYRPGIDDHDFDTKTRHARRFLEEKNKVKVTMMFRGRQVAHPELGQLVLDRVATELADIGKIESAGRLEGKSMTMILTPK